MPDFDFDAYNHDEVEVLFVQEDLVAIITIIVKAFAAFGNGEIIIVATCSPYIKEIGSSLTCPNPLAVNAFHFLVVVVVRHVIWFYS